MQKNKLLYGFILGALSINTVMICLLTFWSIDDRTTLKVVQVEVQELKRRVEMEIKLRQEILPEIKKSTALLSRHNPDLDALTALAYAIKIWQCSDEVVPHDLLTSLIVVESGARYNAISPKGALGLTQIMPTCWPFPHGELINPYKNIELGADILRQNIKQHGLIGGLRVYNAGTLNQNTDAALKYAKKVLETASKSF
jgi:hypothetical protein